MQRGERHPQLEPREVRAQAPVEAARERDVPVGGAVEVDDQRIVEALVVEVGGRPQHAQVIAGVDLLTADLEVGGGDPTTPDDRRLDPHQLLDRGRQQTRIVDHPLALVGVPGEPVDHARQRGGDGVEARRGRAGT